MRPLLILHVFLLALAGCAAPAGAADSHYSLPPGSTSEGRKLYVAKCARCHKFYDPANYSDAKWHEWMEKMSRKAKLKPDQKEILSQYLETFRSGTNAVTTRP